MEAAAAAPVATFRDRRVGLFIFGLLQALFGLVCLGFMGLMAMMLMAADNFGADLGMDSILPSLLIYGVGAAWFLCMGIGSTLCRRWSRDLVLMSSWLWLVFGGLSMIMMTWMLPRMYQRLNEDIPLPSSFATIMLVFMGVFYVLIPGVLVAFYRSPHVKATCQYYDPKKRWTERVPLPVLAVSLITLVSALWMPMTGAYNWAVPVFGTYFTGAAGAAVVLAAVAVLLWVSWGFFRLRLSAWYAAVALAVVGGSSTVITVYLAGWEEFYDQMDLPAEQVEMMKKMFSDSGGEMALMMLPGLLVCLGYLIYVRRYFRVDTA